MKCPKVAISYQFLQSKDFSSTNVCSSYVGVSEPLFQLLILI